MDGKDELDAVMKAVAETPRRDNSAYHKAMSDMRKAFEEAEEKLGGSLKLKMKTKLKRSGKYIVKWTIERKK